MFSNCFRRAFNLLWTSIEEREKKRIKIILVREINKFHFRIHSIQINLSFIYYTRMWKIILMDEQWSNPDEKENKKWIIWCEEDRINGRGQQLLRYKPLSTPIEEENLEEDSPLVTLPRNFLRGELSLLLFFFFSLRKSRERKSNKPIYADYRPRIRGNAQIAAPHGERLGGMKYSGDDS